MKHRFPPSQFVDAILRTQTEKDPYINITHIVLLTCLTVFLPLVIMFAILSTVRFKEMFPFVVCVLILMMCLGWGWLFFHCVLTTLEYYNTKVFSHFHEKTIILPLLVCVIITGCIQSFMTLFLVYLVKYPCAFFMGYTPIVNASTDDDKRL